MARCNTIGIATKRLPASNSGVINVGMMGYFSQKFDM
jgi:hypothetical protein